MISAPTTTRHQTRCHCERSEAIRIPEANRLTVQGERIAAVASLLRNDSLFLRTCAAGNGIVPNGRAVMPAPANGNVPAYCRTRDDVGIVPYVKRVGTAV
ncbi:MAG: hypothetical protein IJT41_06195 [Clostridia bacterium]|nr:hypothetical protein [Clostridia bacterium]